MPKNKMIAKGCPKCEQQVPVACKACPCGHSFFNSRKSIPSVPTVTEDNRRRTQRVRREKPHYYDSLEYDKQLKKIRTRNSECDEDDTTKVHKPKKRKVKKEEEEEDDLINNLSAEKHFQCSIILAELNRKMGSVIWKPRN